MYVSSRLNQSGMSLVSVLVTSAILGMLITSLNAFVVWQLKAAGHTALKADLASIQSMLTDRLAGGVDCELTSAFCDAKTPNGTVIPLLGGLAADGSPIYRVPVEGVVIGRYRVTAVCTSDAGTPSFNLRVGRSTQTAGAQLIDPLTSRDLASKNLFPGPRPVCGSSDKNAQTPEQICTGLGGTFYGGKCQGLGGGANLIGLANPDANGDGTEDGLKAGVNTDQSAAVSCLSNGIQLFAGQTSCDAATPFARDWNGNVIMFPGPIPTASTCYFRQEMCPKGMPGWMNDIFCAAGPDGKLYRKFPHLPEFVSAGIAGKPMRGWSMGLRWCTGGLLAGTPTPSGA